MKLLIKLLLIRIVRVLISIIHILPIDNKKIIFVSFGGKQMSCNPLYIYKSIIKTYPGEYKIIWVKQHREQHFNFNGETITTGTFAYIYNMLTAGCIVTNDTLPSYLKFSKKQLVINTWHGGGLFKQTFGLSDKNQQNYNSKINCIHNKDVKLYLLSSESWRKNVLNKRFEYYGNCLQSGSPRNDIFFGNKEPLTEKIKSFYSIPHENSIVLYAPTFRGSPQNSNDGLQAMETIDIDKTLQALRTRFGEKFTFIYRGHHLMRTGLKNCIDASTYPDMQELLAATDVFISDYSSCLWDFSLTKRPCFIYAPDLKKYSKSPGFESNYKDWPFGIAESNLELYELINMFNGHDYSTKCDSYHNKYESYERGNASDTVATYINDYLRRN